MAGGHKCGDTFNGHGYLCGEPPGHTGKHRMEHPCGVFTWDAVEIEFSRPSPEVRRLVEAFRGR